MRKRIKICQNINCNNLCSAFNNFCSRKCYFGSRTKYKELPKCINDECENKTKNYRTKYCSPECQFKNSKRRNLNKCCREKCDNLINNYRCKFCSKKCRSLFSEEFFPKCKIEECNNKVKRRCREFCSKKCSGKSRQGLKVPQERIDKIKKTLNGKYVGEKNSWFGKHHNEESIKKQKETRKKSYKKEKHPNFGKHHSEDMKDKIRKGEIKAIEEGRKFFKEINHVSVSKSELLWGEKIKETFGIDLIHNFRIKNRFYDFKHPEKKILFEIDGKYWHSSLKSIYKDRIKNDLAFDNGYKIFRFEINSVDEVEESIQRNIGLLTCIFEDGKLEHKDYYYELKKAMKLLAKHKNTIFIGQSIEYSGNATFETLESVSMKKRLELPVSEDLQAGIANGMAIYGMIPVQIFPRMDFALLAMNQLFLHLDKIEYMTGGKLKPRVITRIAIGGKFPLNPQEQHSGNYAEIFKSISTNIEVVELFDAKQIVKEYKRALTREDSKSTILVEYSDMYRVPRIK